MSAGKFSVTPEGEVLFTVVKPFPLNLWLVENALSGDPKVSYTALERQYAIEVVKGFCKQFNYSILKRLTKDAMSWANPYYQFDFDGYEAVDKVQVTTYTKDKTITLTFRELMTAIREVSKKLEEQKKCKSE